MNEFAYAGEVSTRPKAAPTLRELTDYVYFRGNVAGVQREWWYHRFGCETWFLAERDTRTNEMLRSSCPARASRCDEASAAAGRADRPRRATVVVHVRGGRPVDAYEGDTIGSALFAAGRRVFSRSFKYHRPRGLLCCSGSCPNCMMEVDGVPNVRVCAEPVARGAQVVSRRTWSARSTATSLVGRRQVGGRSRRSASTTGR